MQITVELPDDIAQCDNPGREALEALVVAGFRAEVLSEYQGRLLLGMNSRFEFWDFMAANELDFYTIEQLRSDFASVSKTREKRLAAK